MSTIENAVREAIGPAVVGTQVAEMLPTTTLPAVITSAGEAQQGNAKALIFLTSANAAALKMEQSVADDIFNAAAECETLAEWLASVTVFRHQEKEEGREIASTVSQYLSRFSAGWQNRKDRAKLVRDSFDYLKLHGEDMDPFEGINARAAGTDFLDPRTSTYKTAAQFLRDAKLVGEIEKRAKAARKRAEKDAAKRDKERATQEAQNGNPAATLRGDTRQTGDLSAIVQEALNGLIRAIHGNAQMLPEAWIVGVLNTASHAVSVDLPACEKDLVAQIAAGVCTEAEADAARKDSLFWLPAMPEADEDESAES